jgi:hypothetical protein
MASSDLDNLEIAELRRLAAAHKIDSQKTWTKEDYIRAIQNRHKRNVVAKIVYDENEPIAPGFCRIRLPLTPSGSDIPLPIMVNNFKTMIPRNVLVDIPKEARDQLRTSKETVARETADQHGNTVVKIMEVPAYPFDDFGSTPGESGAIKPTNDPREQRLREKYKEIYGNWPRRQSDEWKSFKNGFLEAANKKILSEAADEEIQAVKK